MPLRQSDRMVLVSMSEPALFVGCDPGRGTTTTPAASAR
jgi:hypothetical protein